MIMKKEKLYKDCLICNKPVLVRHISRLERTKYCSVGCRIESIKKEKVEIICIQCKAVYLAYPSNKERIFCSSKCRYDWQASGSWPLAFYKNATKEQLHTRLSEYCNRYTIKKDGCWEWTGTKDKDGYGSVNLDLKNIKRAHRASWILYNGEIPKGILVCHHCDNPSCTNPEHLFLGTAKDNTNDMINKKRRKQGTRLKNFQVTEIKKLLETKKATNQIATMFNVCRATIDNIKYKKAWTNLPKE
jgi:hypothetical protein